MPQGHPKRVFDGANDLRVEGFTDSDRQRSVFLVERHECVPLRHVCGHKAQGGGLSRGKRSDGKHREAIDIMQHLAQVTFARGAQLEKISEQVSPLRDLPRHGILHRLCRGGLAFHEGNAQQGHGNPILTL